MSVTCTQKDRVLTAAISGELDHHAAKAVMAELERRIDAALPHTLILELSKLSFTDSSGIAVVLRAFRHMGRLGGKMKLVHTPHQAEKVFRAAGLDRLIPFE